MATTQAAGIEGVFMWILFTDETICSMTAETLCKDW